MKISIEPIGYVTNDRVTFDEFKWGQVESKIELTEQFESEALLGLETFSHLEIFFHFHLLDPARIITGARHPRKNPDWPLVGIFAQRGRVRPNRIAATIVELISVDGKSLMVRGLDAIDGTPVIDIKPVLKPFLPRGEVRQPDWVDELMADYW